ncbi:hypothetical protein ACSBR1_012421 [Camellia fascicularis]
MFLALQQSMDAITNKVVTHKKALVELQRPFGVFTSHPLPVVHSVLDPSPLVKRPHESNLKEGLRVPTQPMDGLFPIDIDEVDPIVLKISKLEKMFKTSQVINSIPNIDGGLTETIVRLPKRFKMPHMDRFDGAGDPMVHITFSQTF